MLSSTKKILIVDDEKPIRDLLVRWLTAEGYSCQTAENGQIALDLLEKETFALMILDIMLPVISGMEVLDKTTLKHKNLPIIMISAVSNPQIAKRTLGLGAYGYIIKPFEREEILINIENAMQRQRLEEINQAHQNKLEELVAKRSTEIINHKNEMEEALNKLSGLMDQVVAEKNFAVRFENPALKKCYELLDCQKKDCPCYGAEGMRCWQIAGTYCGGVVQGEFTKKHKACSECPVFKSSTPNYTLQIGEHFNNMMNILQSMHHKTKEDYEKLKGSKNS
ncbi:MAG: response regulator [Proteobacteria bacterium]|nr:response regulator [Pseudomonadota bacterium]MBU1717116.1 response regulator [Pseudomonadota bacterium]